jgi:hypothetical protein
MVAVQVLRAGSIMPLMLTSIPMKSIKDAPVPFFIKPIANATASGIGDLIEAELSEQGEFRVLGFLPRGSWY